MRTSLLALSLFTNMVWVLLWYIEAPLNQVAVKDTAVHAGEAVRVVKGC